MPSLPAPPLLPKPEMTRPLAGQRNSVVDDLADEAMLAVVSSAAGAAAAAFGGGLGRLGLLRPWPSSRRPRRFWPLRRPSSSRGTAAARRCGRCCCLAHPPSAARPSWPQASRARPCAICWAAWVAGLVTAAAFGGGGLRALHELHAALANGWRRRAGRPWLARSRQRPSRGRLRSSRRPPRCRRGSRAASRARAAPSRSGRSRRGWPARARHSGSRGT